MHAPDSSQTSVSPKFKISGKPLLAKIKKATEQSVKGIRRFFHFRNASEKSKLVVVPSRKNIKAERKPVAQVTKAKQQTSKEQVAARKPGKQLNWLPKVMWGISAVMVLIVAYLILQFFSLIPNVSAATSQVQISEQAPILPTYSSTPVVSLERVTDPKTIIPDRSLDYILRYSVQPLESIGSIAAKFNLKRETILWSNEKDLRTDPNTIPVNSILYVPPVDGVYYEWKDGDTLDAVAAKYKVDPSAILTWPSNHLDLTDPQIAPGQYVMIPGGQGTPIEWVVTIPYALHSGANRSVDGQCSVTGYYPWSGGFIWPTASHLISGNDFWAGHLGIDIGAYTGDAVWAASAGVVIWAGGMEGGYGNVVVLEHDNGANVWVTLYAHLSAINVHCGDVVSQGQVIAASGNSGNSTGPHLHFEVRENGSFVNPHYVVSP
jgi:LysM repeat protein